VDTADIGADLVGIGFSIVEACPIVPVSSAAYGGGVAIDVASITKDVVEWNASGRPSFREAPLDYLGLVADLGGLVPVFGAGPDAAGIGISLLEGFYVSP